MDSTQKHRIARLAYLLSKFQINIPKKLVNLLPGGEWLQKLSANGAGSTGVGIEQLSQLIRIGEGLGPGTPQEAVDLVQELVDLALDESTLNLKERIDVYALLARLSPMTMIAHKEYDLGDKTQEASVVKFDTGFAAADLVVDRFPMNSLVMFIGPPGIGKTSIMVRLMEAIRTCNAASSVLFIENEMPGELMKARFDASLKRTPFVPGVDKLICGPWEAQDILEYITENPDPDRVIFFDSPDVTVKGGDEGRRFYLEAAYQTLVQIKQKCRMVVVSSQPRRKDMRMTLRSGAESWQKTWYVDLMIGLNRDPKGLQLVSLKNRFGPADITVTVPFDYETLELGQIENEEEYW